jgi:hypothetical protein
VKAKKNRREKKEWKKDKKTREEEKKRGGWIWCFLLWCASCSLSVTTFVPRLTSLAWFRLGPAQYHCWIIIQLVF